MVLCEYYTVLYRVRSHLWILLSVGVLDQPLVLPTVHHVLMLERVVSQGPSLLAVGGSAPALWKRSMRVCRVMVLAVGVPQVLAASRAGPAVTLAECFLESAMFVCRPFSAQCSYC